jgi:oxalate decarboxylase
LVTVFSNGNLHDTFTIAQDEMFFVPSGYLHAIANIGGESAEFVIAFSHHEPEDFGMSGAVGCMNANVMGNTWGIPETAAKGIRYSPEDIVIGKFQGTLDTPWAAGFSNHYKLPVESLPPMLATEFGSARTAREQFWPALEGLSMYSLRLLGTCMREPHWHPQTAEIDPGDIYFIPKGYPHHTENLAEEEIRVLIFFDKTTPEDIGFTGALAAFPGESSRQLLLARRKRCHSFRPIRQTSSWSKKSIRRYPSLAGCAS